MDSDISNSVSDVLRNVVMGRVTEDGSWTEVGRFSDVKTVTFHGEEMPEEFKTRYINLGNEVSFTAELEPTIATRIADEVYKTLVAPFLLQATDQLAKTEENCICYANPDDHDAIEFIKSVYGTMPLRVLKDVVYTKAVEKGIIYLVPESVCLVSRAFNVSPLVSIQATSTIIDEMATKAQQEPPVRDISWIRKQMKHCKNPMERKALEKELNAAFNEKAKKRRRKNE